MQRSVLTVVSSINKLTWLHRASGDIWVVLDEYKRAEG
jgi:hypothetical protein